MIDSILLRTTKAARGDVDTKACPQGRDIATVTATRSDAANLMMMFFFFVYIPIGGTTSSIVTKAAQTFASDL